MPPQAKAAALKEAKEQNLDKKAKDALATVTDPVSGSFRLPPGASAHSL